MDLDVALAHLAIGLKAAHISDHQITELRRLANACQRSSHKFAADQPDASPAISEAVKHNFDRLVDDLVGDLLSNRTQAGAQRSGGTRSTLIIVSLIAVVISAWGGIVPYLGPTFGYSADGSGAWHWNLAHAILALSPAIAGILAGALLFLGAPRSPQRTRRLGLGLGGVLALTAGAWFVVGPWAWVLTLGSSSYLVPATPFRTLANLLGYSFGPGLILIACGAFALGWARRHQPSPVPVPAVTGSGATEPVIPSPVRETRTAPSVPPGFQQALLESPDASGA